MRSVSDVTDVQMCEKPFAVLVLSVKQMVSRMEGEREARPI